MEHAPTSTLQQVDFDLRQILRIRLIDPSPPDVNTVARQLGLQPQSPSPQSAGHPADIIIRLVDRLERAEPVRYLNIDEIGYTNDAFLILRGKQKTKARVEMPFDQIGSNCEIRCERGLAAIPLLIAVVNFTMLAKGALPIHASAFEYQGKGVLATGWSKGGKTELLLAFMSHGAHYIGDEWVYLTPDGKEMFGIPEPIRLWDWHLQQLPEYQARLSRGERRRLRAVRWSVRLTGGVWNRWLGRLTGRARALLKHQLHVDVSPERLFRQPADSGSSRLAKVFFVNSHDAPEIMVGPVDPQEIASRMLFSLQYEQMPFSSSYLAYRFAFPERSNGWLAAAPELQRQRLEQFLRRQESYFVAHPYPVDISALYEAVCPYIEQAPIMPSGGNP